MKKCQRRENGILFKKTYMSKILVLFIVLNSMILCIACSDDSLMSQDAKTQTVASPIITPGNTNISPLKASFVQVSMSCSTPYSTIWYTTDGSEPNGVNGKQYDGPFYLTLGPSESRVKAIGHREGYTDSSITTAIYTRNTDLYEEQEDSRINVNNLENTDIVLFKNTTSSTNLLGGVRALANNHGVPNMTPGLHVIKVVTAAEYAANPQSPRVCYSFLVNRDAYSSAFTISFLSGDGTISIQNNTDGYIELRNGSYTGSRIGVLRPAESMQMARPAGNLSLFALALYPRFNVYKYEGIKVLRSKQQTIEVPVAGTANCSIDQGDISANNHLPAYIRIKSLTDRGVRMLRDSVIQRSVWNCEVINAGSYDWSYNYEIQGTVSSATDLKFESFSGTVATTGNYFYKQGYVYTVTIPSTGTLATVVEDGKYETVFP